jgi:hypothetical protein
MNTGNNVRNIGIDIFCAIRVLSKHSLWASLCIPLLFLGNKSVKTFSLQQIIVEGVVLYDFRVVSKEIR